MRKNSPERIEAMRQVAKLLTEMRVRRGQNRSDIARKIEVSRARINSWENAKLAPNIKIFDKVAKAYGMTKAEKKMISDLLYTNGLKKIEENQKGQGTLTEAEVFVGFIALPVETRRRILAAINAYEGD
jgi:DNA-binding XRE family transcriptional regulator